LFLRPVYLSLLAIGGKGSSGSEAGNPDPFCGYLICATNLLRLKMC
jgi:hypothetical protein